MSCSSPCPSPERLPRRQALRVLAHRVGLAGLASLGVAAQAQANDAAAGRPREAPATREPLVHQGVTLWPRGEGQLRFWGLEVYTARLWTADGFDPTQHARHPLALELQYAHAFSARDIAQRSLLEMKRQTHIEKALEADWTDKLSAILPDVKPGDRLRGWHRPTQGALFQSGPRVLGRVDDPVFSALFFGIWLSPATSEPGLRTALLQPN